MSEFRRKAIIKQLEESDLPITGSELAEVFDVSRQVIVQDIAIIRASGLHIMATSNGYLIPKHNKSSQLIKTFVSKHNGFENMEEELMIIVEYGGRIIDVIVEHPVYGEIVGTLHISSKEDVNKFLDRVRESNANPLSILTQGDHIHTIEVPSEKVFRLIMDELRVKGFVE